MEYPKVADLFKAARACGLKARQVAMLLDISIRTYHNWRRTKHVTDSKVSTVKNATAALELAAERGDLPKPGIKEVDLLAIYGRCLKRVRSSKQFTQDV